jgi:hypothetical protein
VSSRRKLRRRWATARGSVPKGTGWAWSASKSLRRSSTAARSAGLPWNSDSVWQPRHQRLSRRVYLSIATHGGHLQPLLQQEVAAAADKGRHRGLVLVEHTLQANSEQTCHHRSRARTGGASVPRHPPWAAVRTGLGGGDVLGEREVDRAPPQGVRRLLVGHAHHVDGGDALQDQADPTRAHTAVSRQGRRAAG